jgi:hypothetical protein
MSCLGYQIRRLCRFFGISRHAVAAILCSSDRMAEGEGFEPPVRFPVQRFSRPPVSTTHTSLRFFAARFTFF